MREIKFRAWDKDKKIWIPGAYGFHILGECMLIGGLFQDYRIEDLNNIILMQYTGLKDKNGVEIYEGDVVTGFGGLRGEIEFHFGMFQVVWPLPNFYPLITPNLEIIGNIHENPELLNLE